VVEVDLASFTMGDAQRDQLARSEEILGASTAPTARYATRSFTALGGDRYEVVADLTLKGVTRELRHPVRITVAGDTAEAEGEVVLRRPDFGIGMRQLASPDPLAFEVVVRFELQARRAGG
jgi:polyisoprenoid-binding protein YceI